MYDPTDGCPDCGTLTADHDEECSRTAQVSITDKLPIDSDLAYRLADEAIGLFLECRDQHGQDETQARATAALEIAEGASAEIR